VPSTSSDSGWGGSMSPGEFDRAQFLADLKACGALSFGTFTLASGKTSSFYVDIKKAITRPHLLRTIAEAMVPYASRADRIAGVELGAVPIAAALSLASDKPYLMVRKEAKGHGTKKDFEGELRKGERVLFVEDVVTTGGTLRGAIERLRASGALVEDVACVVDREEGGKIALAEITVRLHALLTAKDLLAAK
jgi:orotate phosphoribosyltransferase